MRSRYQAGNYGYGHAKQALFEVILARFKKEREHFFYFEKHPEEVIRKLEEGEEKARDIGLEVLNRVKQKIGF
jgi:tryptophanyl-tRNA synthetase